MRHFLSGPPSSRTVPTLPERVHLPATPTQLVPAAGLPLLLAPRMPSTIRTAVPRTRHVAHRAQRDRSPTIGTSADDDVQADHGPPPAPRRETRLPRGPVRRKRRRPANFTVPRSDRGLGGANSGPSAIWRRYSTCTAVSTSPRLSANLRPKAPRQSCRPPTPEGWGPVPPVSASGAALDNSLDHHRAADHIPAVAQTAPSKPSGSELSSSHRADAADALRRHQRPARWRRLVLFAAITDDLLRRHQHLGRVRRARINDDPPRSRAPDNAPTTRVPPILAAMTSTAELLVDLRNAGNLTG